MVYVFSILPAEDEGIALESVIIKAERMDKDFRKLPVSGSVLYGDNIDMQDAKQTTDLLSILPGVFIRRTSAFGRADVDIRGIGGNGRQIGIFIDGRPDKMSLFGCVVTHTLPFKNVDRIELIRGPESVLYGSEAFGGIVNIVTKRPQKRIQGNITGSYGTFNTQNYKIEQGGKLENSEYYITLNKQQTDGHKTNARYDANDFTAKYGYTFGNKSELFLSGKYFGGIKNEPAPSIAGTWNDYQRGSFDLSYDLKAGINDMSIKYYRSFGEHKFSDGFHSTDFTDGFMLHNTARLIQDNTLNAGIDSRYQFADVLNTSPAGYKKQYHKYEYGVYVNDEHTFFKKLSLTLGARYNMDEISDDNITTKAGLVYDTKKNLIFRVLRSEGFRSPQLNDLYFMPPSNPDLKPERVVNHEVGARYYTGGINFDISGFVMNGTDLIEVRNGKNRNIGNFEYKGIETSAGYKIMKSLDLIAGYTYSDYGTKTGGKPQDKATTMLKYSENKLSAMLSVNYVARYFANDNLLSKIPDYIVADARIAYELTSGTKIFVSIDNLTNEAYQIYSGNIYDMPGRSMSAGISYGF